MKSFKEFISGLHLLLMEYDDDTLDKYEDFKLLTSNDEELYYELRDWLFEKNKRGMEADIIKNGNCCIDAITLKDCFENEKMSFLSILQEIYLQPLTLIGVNVKEDSFIKQNTQNLIYLINDIVMQKSKIVNINVDFNLDRDNVLLNIMQDIIDMHYVKDINGRYIMLEDVIRELKLKYEN